MSCMPTRPRPARSASPRPPSRCPVSGGIPDDVSKEGTIAAVLTRRLSTTHRVDDTLYRQAENTFGTKGLTDIAIYYTVCATLNLFEIPAPHLAAPS